MTLTHAMLTLRWRPGSPCFTCPSLASSWKRYHNSMTFQVNTVGSCKSCCSFSVTERISLCDSLESHNQWGRPGGPQGAAVGCSGEDAEGEANSLISQTVAMAIAGTATASPISRPSSFLLNSQVILLVSGVMFQLENTQGARICRRFSHFVVVCSPRQRPGESSTRQLHGRVKSQSSHLSAVGTEECWWDGVTEMVHRFVCVTVEPPAGSPLPLCLLLWVQGRTAVPCVDALALTGAVSDSSFCAHILCY